MSRRTPVLVAALCVALCAALSACSGSPVKGMAVPASNAPTAAPTTTTTTETSRSSVEPTTTTIPPTTTTTTAAPVLPFAIEGLLTGGELAAATKVSEFANNLRPQINPTPDNRGLTARYEGYRAAVDLTVIAEESGSPVYYQWLNEAKKDGTYDPSACPTFGFCSGGDPAQAGQSYGPTTVTFMVSKGAGSLTVRIQVTNIANPNTHMVLRDLSQRVNERLSK